MNQETEIPFKMYKINNPEELKQVAIKDLPQICEEIRETILNELSRNPGHLGSSLGTVELSVALHYVFNTPYDRLIWDVGHQAYAHKILTGRRERFSTNRKLGGIRPFTAPEESEYDAFTGGHASNSISAALGMAVAAQIKNEKRKTVAIIGDGAMSGGLAFEGLNNASSTPNNLLIILNDNNMAIDRSVGGMKEYLIKLTTNSTYNRLRFKFAQLLSRHGWMDEKKRGRILRFNNSLKSLFSNQQNVFEGMNIRYFGPFDGHNVQELVRVLTDIKDMDGPKLLHVHTIKGHGYAPAEEAATIWHAPGKFDVENGTRITTEENENTPPLFQHVFGETLLELAQTRPDIVGITPAMGTGCSMNILMDKMPNKAFDVGIAEGHAVTFAAGMAKDGLMPFCNVYSSFSQRAYDNIIHDVAISGLNVVLCLDRAGLVGEDGPTHHGVFDLAALRPIPNLTIASPMNEPELRNLMYTASLPNKGAFVIRYPRGRGVTPRWKCPFQEIPIGKGRCLKAGRDIAVISLGPIGNTAGEAIREYEKAHEEVSIAHYDLRFLKPLDTEMLHEIGKKYEHILTIEDGVINGGMGSAILEFMSENGFRPQIHRLGIPDRFIEHGTVNELHKICHLDKTSIIRELENMNEKKSV